MGNSVTMDPITDVSSSTSDSSAKGPLPGIRRSTSKIRVLQVETPSEAEGCSVTRNNVGPQAESSGDVNELVFGSSFLSSTASTRHSQSETSLEEGQVDEESLQSMDEVQTDAVNDHDTLIEEKTDPKKSVADTNNVQSFTELNEATDTTDNNGSMAIIKDQELGESDMSAKSIPVRGYNVASTKVLPEFLSSAVEATFIDSKDIAENKNAGQESSTVTSEESATMDEEKVAMEAPKPVESPHSILPHMRPDFQAPALRQYTAQESKVSPHFQTEYVIETKQTQQVIPATQNPPRHPRAFYPNYYPPPHYGNADREHIVRLSAQLMKAQNDLNTERKNNIHLRQTIEGEHQQKTEAALSSMLTDLLQKQVEALKLNAKNEATARELRYREQKIEQLEVYLSEGQKQFNYELDRRGLRPVDIVEQESIRRDAELAIQRDIAVIEGDIKTQHQHLRLREAAQQMREQQYKALIRDSIELEVRETTLSPDKAAEIAEVEYNNGFAAGKQVARRDAEEEGRKKGFLEGYAACQTAQTAIANLRAGRMALDSAELDFLFDAAHPRNLYNIGVQLGEMSKKKDMMQRGGKVEIKAAAAMNGEPDNKKLDDSAHKYAKTFSAPLSPSLSFSPLPLNSS